MRIAIVVIGLGVNAIMTAQLNRDLAGMEYMYSPAGSDGLEYQEITAKVNLPMVLKSGVLFNSLEFNAYNLSLEEAFAVTPELEKLYGFKYQLAYLQPLPKNWSISAGAGVQVSSNLQAGLTSKDLFFNGNIVAIKRYSKGLHTSGWMFGLGYTAITGQPMVVPFVSYFNNKERWSYKIGIPEVSVRYRWNAKNSLSTYARIKGMYAHLGDPVSAGDPLNSNEAEYLSYRMGLLGLEYQYQLSRFWSVYIKSEYAVYGEYSLENADKEEIFDQNTAKGMYFSGGLRFNILKNRTANKKLPTKAPAGETN